MIRLRKLRSTAIDPSRALTSDIYVPCKDGLSYLPFQLAGIEYASKRARTLIADEPGSGKTIQSMGLCNLFTDARRILVICPGFLKPHWRNEALKWDTKGLNVGIAEGTKEPFPNTDICVVNYDILKAHREALRAITWDMLIVDEVHKLKNKKADRTREVWGGIRRDADNKIVERVSPLQYRALVTLTGTPMLNGKPKEMWNLIQALDPDGLGRDWFAFAKRYCDLQEITRFNPAKGIQERVGWLWDGAENLDELQKIMRERFMIRRLKIDILPQLPAKTRMVIPITGRNATIKKMIARQAVEFDRLLKGRNEEDLLTADFTQFSAEMKKLGLEMIDPTIEIVESDLEENEKIVVMCYHPEVARGIAAHWSDRAVVIDGDVPVAKRQALVDRFQDDSAIRVLVGTIGAAGVGFTMTKAHLMVFAERAWVPGDVTQAEDRIHRIGQDEKVLYKHLVLEGSLAERQVAVLIKKQNISDLALDKKELI